MDAPWRRVRPSGRRLTREAKALEIPDPRPSSTLFCCVAQMIRSNHKLAVKLKTRSMFSQSFVSVLFNLLSNTVQRLQAADTVWTMRRRLIRWCHTGGRGTDRAGNTHMSTLVRQHSLLTVHVLRCHGFFISKRFIFKSKNSSYLEQLSFNISGNSSRRKAEWLLTGRQRHGSGRLWRLWQPFFPHEQWTGIKQLFWLGWRLHQPVSLTAFVRSQTSALKMITITASPNSLVRFFQTSDLSHLTSRCG